MEFILEEHKSVQLFSVEMISLYRFLYFLTQYEPVTIYFCVNSGLQKIKFLNNYSKSYFMIPNIIIAFIRINRTY